MWVKYCEEFPLRPCKIALCMLSDDSLDRTLVYVIGAWNPGLRLVFYIGNTGDDDEWKKWGRCFSFWCGGSVLQETDDGNSSFFFLGWYPKETPPNISLGLWNTVTRYIFEVEKNLRWSNELEIDIAELEVEFDELVIDISMLFFTRKSRIFLRDKWGFGVLQFVSTVLDEDELLFS